MKGNNSMEWPGHLGLCLSLLTFASSLAAQSLPSSNANPNTIDFSKARKFIHEQMVKWSIPSISVAAARRGEILWEEGFGWADRENRIPATEHTMYYMASINKSFTAMALMVLQERKQLDLDRPVNDYLSGAKLKSPAWNPAEATVRRVANHTAGLTTFNLGKRLPIDETISRYGILFWPPGVRLLQSRLQDPRRRRGSSLRDVLFQLCARRNLLAPRHDARVRRHRSRTRKIRGAEIHHQSRPATADWRWHLLQRP